jgi:hypothetical protein
MAHCSKVAPFKEVDSWTNIAIKLVSKSLVALRCWDFAFKENRFNMQLTFKEATDAFKKNAVDTFEHPVGVS